MVYTIQPIFAAAGLNMLARPIIGLRWRQYRYIIDHIKIYLSVITSKKFVSMFGLYCADESAKNFSLISTL